MDKKDISKVTSLNKFSLNFEKNIGQHNKDVKFIVRGHEYTAFFTEREVVLTLMQEKVDNSLEKENHNVIENRLEDFNSHKMQELLEKKEYDVSVLRMILEGVSTEVKIIGENEQEAKSNYFRGNNPEKWVTNIPCYEKIRYKEVYPGIDVVFYGNSKQLEHDFIVKPGADPNMINLSFQGADKVEIDDEGNLRIRVKIGEIALQKPKVLQIIKGVNKEIETSYNIKVDNKVGFHIGKYDNTIELNIDPILSYFTSLGGSGDDYGRAIVADKFSNVYITGYTNSNDFSTTEWRYNGGVDVFVTKLDGEGGSVYFTYLGGTNDDYGLGIKVDDLGNVYVTGSTCSSDFPTTSRAYSTSLKGYMNGFITKLNENGSTLVYSTYLGGSNMDSGYGIAVDVKGFAYVTGPTGSKNFPTTSGAYDTIQTGAKAFVTKLNENGSNLVYSTLLGGGQGDIAQAIVVDEEGNAYITGATTSKDFPTTPGAYQTSYHGLWDAVVTKLNRNSSK